MKHLPKHLRPRWRYLAVEIEAWPDAAFDRGRFQRELWFAAQNLLGDVASAEMDLSVLRFALDAGAGHAVVRARRGEVDRARAALACVDGVAGHPVGVAVRGVSGTVRACEEKYLSAAGHAGRAGENPNGNGNESGNGNGNGNGNESGSEDGADDRSRRETTVVFEGDERRAWVAGDRVDVEFDGAFVGAARSDCE